MAVRHVLILLGSLWEIVRFFIVITLLLQVLALAGEGSFAVVPWLLLGGSGNLLVAAGGIMLSLFPGKYGELIGLLRLGKILAVFSFLLLVLSGSLGFSARIELLQLGPWALNEGVALFGIFILDVLFLVALAAWRRDKGSASPALTP